MEKTNRIPFLYKVGRMILGPIYKWYYNPKIIGLENIKQDGSILIVGNHIHLYDQCNSIISTKRFITYMAKKEYFDSKKTRWFFKSVGCIPVDRTKKSSSAVLSAINVLENKGAVGIFPEGTRNALKEERIKNLHEDYFEDIDYEIFKEKIKKSNPKLSQIKYLENIYLDKKIDREFFLKSLDNPDKAIQNLINRKIIKSDDYYESLLLPFKYGAVSMASKTNATIIPVVVTGKYKFRSKNLIVRFGKGFKTSEMSLEKANEKLRNEMKKLIKKSLEESK